MLNHFRNIKRLTKDALLMCKYNIPSVSPEKILQTEDIKNLTEQFKKNGFLKFENNEFLMLLNI